LLGIKTSALYYKLEKYGIGVIESRAGAAQDGAGEAGDGLLDDDERQRRGARSRREG